MDAVLKIIPPIGVLVLAGLAAVFVGVHNWRGYPNYNDTIRDRAFLTALVLVVAAACLYAINRGDRIDSGQQPLILVPYFRNDESDQARAAIGSQLESGLASVYFGRRTVVYVNSFITEESAAAATAERYGATAVVYGPVVMRDKETTTSFKIYFAHARITQPYAILPLVIPRERLDDIVLRVAGAEKRNDSIPGPLAPLISRIESLEGAIAHLQAATMAGPTSATQTADYQHRYALVVGSNGPNDLSRLANAEKDGGDVSEALRRIGFDVTTLLGGAATHDAVLHSLAQATANLGSEDLLVFYFAGHSYLPQNGGALNLILSDFQLDRSGGALSLTELGRRLQSSSVGSVLIVLDASYGKSGFSLANDDLSGGRVIQVLTGTGDREAGMESIEGGVFTRALIASLASAGAATRMSTQELHRTISNRMATSAASQHPQLLTIGDREIILRLP